MNASQIFLSQFDPQKVRDQYAANAKQLREMEANSMEKGGKFRGFTTKQLTEKAAAYEKLAKTYGQ